MKTVIETGRLLLREYVWEDYDDLYAVISDPETMRHYPKPYDADGTRRWLSWSLDNYARYGFGLWAAVLKETGAFVGDCGLTMQPIDGEQLPEIGYHIRRDCWRRGYAKEAGLAVRDWAFRNTDFDTLYSYMNAANVASWSTARSLGMQKRKEYQDPNERLMYVYAITREEWESLRG